MVEARVVANADGRMNKWMENPEPLYHTMPEAGTTKIKR